MRYTDISFLILKASAYRETSTLVSGFSAEAGRFSMIMKGTRRRKDAPLVQPFVLAHVSCVGKGALLTNTKYEVQKRFEFQGNILSAGFYVLEVLSRSLVEYQSEPAVYHLSLKTLHELEAIQEHMTDHSRSANNGVQMMAAVASRLRPFEIRLLDLLGYGVDFLHEAGTGQPITQGEYYALCPGEGFVAQPAFSADKEADRYPGQVLQDIAQSDYSKIETLNAAQKITHCLLPELVGHEPLLSRSLWST
ncbi:MAG: DNA repair protein RecO [Pseudomonadota bacterium]